MFFWIIRACADVADSAVEPSSDESHTTLVGVTVPFTVAPAAMPDNSQITKSRHLEQIGKGEIITIADQIVTVLQSRTHLQSLKTDNDIRAKTKH